VASSRRVRQRRRFGYWLTAQVTMTNVTEDAPATIVETCILAWNSLVVMGGLPLGHVHVGAIRHWDVSR
jgi:hypothetical protein